MLSDSQHKSYRKVEDELERGRQELLQSYATYPTYDPTHKRDELLRRVRVLERKWYVYRMLDIGCDLRPYYEENHGLRVA